MSSEGLIVPSKEALETDSRSWAAKARGLQIVDRESCLNASHLLRSVKTLRVQVQAWFAPHLEAAMETKRKAEAARKALADERDRMEAPLVDAETVLKRSLLAYESEQERVRLEQERALQAEAQRQAEAVTLAAAAAMELEAEATGDEALRQEAVDILEQPIEAPTVFVQKAIPKVQGVTYRDNWKAHPAINVKALAAAVAAGTVPVTFLTPNLTAINQFARATQGAQSVAGVKFFNDRQIAARG
jgi:hypothetical protein